MGVTLLQRLTGTIFRVLGWASAGSCEQTISHPTHLLKHVGTVRRRKTASSYSGRAVEGFPVHQDWDRGIAANRRCILAVHTR